LDHRQHHGRHEYGQDHHPLHDHDDLMQQQDLSLDRDHLHDHLHERHDLLDAHDLLDHHNHDIDAHAPLDRPRRVLPLPALKQSSPPKPTLKLKVIYSFQTPHQLS
jgi:hypothetical protein